MGESFGVRRVIAALLVATAVLFAVGVAVERRDDQHPKSAEHPEAEHAGEEAHNEANEHDESRVLGVDTESAPVVAVAVGVSIALAALVWFSDSPAVLANILIVGTVFAVFDVAEVLHQLNRSQTGLALTAGLVAVGHAAIAALGATALRRRSAQERVGA
jgi:Flp pilus assembly protein TadB